VWRIQALWEGFRSDVMASFQNAPTRKISADEYLGEMDRNFAYDAYNSLSIEGYRVTPELIERVKTNAWNPDVSETDKQERNALAARGYYLAYQEVKGSIQRILTGEVCADVISDDLQSWYRQLFSPAVLAGILRPLQLAGYRNNPVYIRGARHVPPPAEAVVDCMELLLELIKAEPEPAVRAVLGHYIFVYIHPYTDGNGRIARFLMNVAFASGGYPWTVVRLSERERYLSALASASDIQDIRPFAQFIADEIRATGG
jgi:Fic family protein